MSLSIMGYKIGEFGHQKRGTPWRLNPKVQILVVDPTVSWFLKNDNMKLIMYIMLLADFS